MYALHCSPLLLWVLIWLCRWCTSMWLLWLDIFSSLLVSKGWSYASLPLHVLPCGRDDGSSVCSSISWILSAIGARWNSHHLQCLRCKDTIILFGDLFHCFWNFPLSCWFPVLVRWGFFSSISMVSVSAAFESCVAYSNRACCLCCLSKAHISSMSNIWKAVKRFLPVNRSVAPFKICCHLVALYWLKLQDSYHTFYVQIGEGELWLKALHDALGVGMCFCLFLVLP